MRLTGVCGYGAWGMPADNRLVDAPGEIGHMHLLRVCDLSRQTSPAAPPLARQPLLRDLPPSMRKLGMLEVTAASTRRCWVLLARLFGLALLVRKRHALKPPAPAFRGGRRSEDEARTCRAFSARILALASLHPPGCLLSSSPRDSTLLPHLALVCPASGMPPRALASIYPCADGHGRGGMVCRSCGCPATT